MDVSAVYTELYDRIPPLVEAVVAELDADRLAARPDPEGNSVGWLTWHLARVQDHHVAELLDVDQVYVGGWAERFGLPADPGDIGYGHSAEQVAAVRAEGPDVIVGYLDAVMDRTRELLGGLTSDELDRVVDEHWEPPVTLGVRLVSIADDSLQHVGQAAYLRGLLERGNA